jgi:hypothetical protein
VDYLLIECEKLESSLSVLGHDAHILNDYGVDLRYPGLSVSEGAAKDAIKAARAIRAAVRKALGL